mmetsp:Transcript_1403/g.4800  ORF Transcript_1403/g.4800 Transcript_1403/m.4800 type:complete len:221 (-) Transcript_1403:223-885(-)
METSPTPRVETSVGVRRMKSSLTASSEWKNCAWASSEWVPGKKSVGPMSSSTGWSDTKHVRRAAGSARHGVSGWATCRGAPGSATRHEHSRRTDPPPRTASMVSPSGERKSSRNAFTTTASSSGNRTSARFFFSSTSANLDSRGTRPTVTASSLRRRSSATKTRSFSAVSRLRAPSIRATPRSRSELTGESLAASSAEGVSPASLASNCPRSVRPRSASS